MKTDVEKVVDIIRDAGGKIIGRTRLQKTACLLELAGCGEGFCFVYHRYGPFCEKLTRAVERARILKRVHEEEKRAGWGGLYSIYTIIPTPDHLDTAPAHLEPTVRTRLAHEAVKADALILELAVTAAFFAKKKYPNPWQEVKSYKPEKAKDEYMEEAKTLYKSFCEIADTLPKIDS